MKLSLRIAVAAMVLWVVLPRALSANEMEPVPTGVSDWTQQVTTEESGSDDNLVTQLTADQPPMDGDDSEMNSNVVLPLNEQPLSCVQEVIGKAECSFQTFDPSCPMFIGVSFPPDSLP